MDVKTLKNDLLKDYKYRTELHAHTSPASSCSEIAPEDVVAIYKNLGYDAVTIANHFTYEYQNSDKQTVIDRFFGDFERAKKKGEELGINVILAAEIRFTENDNDYLVYGVTRKMLEEIYDLLPLGVDNFRRTYAMPDSVFLQAHPFRDGMVRANPEILDGIEVFNLHPNHNSKIGLAAVWAKENNYSIVTAGSDYHHLNRGHEGMSAILSRTLPCESFDIADILKNGDYLLEAGKNHIIIP